MANLGRLGKKAIADRASSLLTSYYMGLRSASATDKKLRKYGLALRNRKVVTLKKGPWYYSDEHVFDYINK